MTTKAAETGNINSYFASHAEQFESIKNNFLKNHDINTFLNQYDAFQKGIEKSTSNEIAQNVVGSVLKMCIYTEYTRFYTDYIFPLLNQSMRENVRQIQQAQKINKEFSFKTFLDKPENELRRLHSAYEHARQYILANSSRFFNLIYGSTQEIKNYTQINRISRTKTTFFLYDFLAKDVMKLSNSSARVVYFNKFLDTLNRFSLFRDMKVGDTSYNTSQRRDIFTTRYCNYLANQMTANAILAKRLYTDEQVLEMAKKGTPERVKTIEVSKKENYEPVLVEKYNRTQINRHGTYRRTIEQDDENGKVIVRYCTQQGDIIEHFEPLTLTTVAVAVKVVGWICLSGFVASTVYSYWKDNTLQNFFWNSTDTLKSMWVSGVKVLTDWWQNLSFNWENVNWNTFAVALTGTGTILGIKALVAGVAIPTLLGVGSGTVVVAGFGIFTAISAAFAGTTASCKILPKDAAYGGAWIAENVCDPIMDFISNGFLWINTKDKSELEKIPDNTKTHLKVKEGKNDAFTSDEMKGIILDSDISSYLKRIYMPNLDSIKIEVPCYSELLDFAQSSTQSIPYLSFKTFDNIKNSCRGGLEAQDAVVQKGFREVEKHLCSKTHENLKDSVLYYRSQGDIDKFITNATSEESKDYNLQQWYKRCDDVKHSEYESLLKKFSDQVDNVRKGGAYRESTEQIAGTTLFTNAGSGKNQFGFDPSTLPPINDNEGLLKSEILDIIKKTSTPYFSEPTKLGVEYNLESKLILQCSDGSTPDVNGMCKNKKPALQICSDGTAPHNGICGAENKCPLGREYDSVSKICKMSSSTASKPPPEKKSAVEKNVEDHSSRSFSSGIMELYENNKTAFYIGGFLLVAIMFGVAQENKKNISRLSQSTSQTWSKPTMPQYQGYMQPRRR